MSGFIEICNCVHGGIYFRTVRCSDISLVIKDFTKQRDGWPHMIKYFMRNEYDEPIATEVFETADQRDARYREVMLELTGNGCALRDKLIRKHQDEIQENKGE